MWQIDVSGGELKAQIVPAKGKLSNLLKVAESVKEDPNLKQAMLDNPL